MVAIHIMSIDSLLTSIQCMFDLNTPCHSFTLNPSYSFDRVVLLIRIAFRWDDGNTVFRHMIFFAILLNKLERECMLQRKDRVH